jgi:soluble lytic murein transglycosylase-like protein
MGLRFLFSLLCFFLVDAGQASSNNIEPRLREKIKSAANRYRIDPLLVEAIMHVESNYSEKAISPKGAIGLMQLMPKTAQTLGVTNPFHGLSNLMGACEYLRSLMDRFSPGELSLILAAYNAGPANVIRYGGIPPFPETKKYVQRVLKRYRLLKAKP